MCCGVHFYRSRRYQVLYQRSIHAVLIMSILRKKKEFYKGESDPEVIVIAAGVLGRVLFQQVFPLWRPFPPHESLSFPYCYLKWDTKWINSQGDVMKIFCLWRVFLWEYAIQKLLIPSLQFLGECHQPTEQTLRENPGGSRKGTWLGLMRQNRIFFFAF